MKSLMIIQRMKKCHLCASFLLERESESLIRSWRRNLDEQHEISHDCPPDEKLPIVCLCVSWTPLFNQQRKWKFDQILKKEVLKNDVNSITIVSQIKIATCMPFAILFWVPLLRERGKLLCSHIMEGCPIKNAIKSSANEISSSAPVAIGCFLRE